MTKSQLIEALAKASNTDKRVARSVFEGLVSLIHSNLKKGGEVKLHDLGKFRVSHRRARVGRNPATGAPIQIPAKNVVRFSLSKALRDLGPAASRKRRT
ncbi:MAG: HU family DNA-binding protein [Acidobacteriota bacterium]